ncbi:MAG: quaternary ammonium compound efflux SMR transporter SugE [Gammaproteobacteria bacterium]
MAWWLLVFAGLFEVTWAVSLKYAAGFTRPLASILTLIAIIISMALLGFAVKVLPIGTAYAVWTGIGAVGTVMLGILLFGDSVNLIRIVCLVLIVAGIIGLKFTGK